MFSYRKCCFYLFVLCLLVMSAALYIQYGLHVEPCLLCIVQRIFLAALGLIALIASLHRQTVFSRWIYNSLALIFCALGVLAAGRQVWLQHLPPPEKADTFCVPGSQYLLNHASLATLFKAIVSGTPECSQVTWTLWGWSLAEWSLLLFLVLSVGVICSFWRR